MKTGFRLRALVIGVTAVFMAGAACGVKPKADYPFQPVAFTDVRVADGFWAPRLETNRAVTIPFAFKQCEETGRIKNFEIAGGLAEGGFASRSAFDDSDVFKIIEGASYALHIGPDARLDQYLDGLIEKIAAAQEEDGYLYTARTIEPVNPMKMAGKERWSNLRVSHELYNVGHFYEAAVAHHLATGKKSLLNVALKNADLLVRTFGPGKKHAAPGHQEIEIGLVKLFRLTGKREYLDLAKFFLDVRGRTESGRTLYGEYSQDHKPVTEQTEAVGHAVRAMYMYAGMADVAALTGDAAYIAAVDKIWEDVVFKKTYLTGGIGASGDWEGFGPAYFLPNATAYCETCASIASALWNERMFLLQGDSKYIDVLERGLYNGVLSGIGLSGDLFFYDNPLASSGKNERSSWFGCACCPSNVSRFMPSIPGYIYAVKGDSVYVNLFAAGEAQIRTKDLDLSITQDTRYPWDGQIKIAVHPRRRADFAVHVRVPGWSRNKPVPGDLYRYEDSESEAYSIKVNGEPFAGSLEKGYAPLRRTWTDGDIIEVDLPMPVRRAAAHPEVKEDRGKVALERGPVVYCAEWPDNQGGIDSLFLDDNVPLSAEFRPDLFNGVTVIKGRVPALEARPDGKPGIGKKRDFLAIPYYAWAHRGPGEMAVWLPREEINEHP
ncbi:MAG: glycoside hydrolase family 127 protein [Acidobacteriota bacterium]|nr:glycoside hydrolase family 127 protein [Acidobacteriota bacterium]